MFVDKILKDNKNLVDTAFNLFDCGLAPDTYILDLDKITENATAIYNKACECGVQLFFMLKQIGRNPLVAKKLVEIGYAGCVCVDFKDAQVMKANNIPIAHMGHLVQIPNSMLMEYLSYGVGVITVFSKEKLLQINEACEQLGIVQNISLRVTLSGDNIYDSQECGFSEDEIKEIATLSRKLKNVKIQALTTFPAFLFDGESGDIKSTVNLESMLKMGELLGEMGFEINQYNAPSATCVRVLDFFKGTKLNVGEPGHGLTGTTPLHAVKECVEKVAYCYLTEYSHTHKGKGYLYGGGHYRRGNTKFGIYKSHGEYKKTNVKCALDSSIDYHYEISDVLHVGEPVVLCARTQIFVTRSDVCVVGGISSGKPEILGVFNAQGDKK